MVHYWASNLSVSFTFGPWYKRVYEYVVNDKEDSYLQGNEMIMKTAWGSSARIFESDIYLPVAIDQPPDGLAMFECGGDV